MNGFDQLLTVVAAGRALVLMHEHCRFAKEFRMGLERGVVHLDLVGVAACELPSPQWEHGWVLCGEEQGNVGRWR